MTEDKERIGHNPMKFIGRYGQVRLPAAHKWLWDRQGAHAGLGLLVRGVGGCWVDV